jgi:OMF family outer membrane factor
MFGSYENVGPIPKKDTYYELSNDFTYSVTGQLLQPISQLYRLKLTLSTSRINVDINQEKHKSQNHKIKLQVKQVYYALAQAQSSLKAADSRLAAAREMQRVAEESVAKQSGLKVDSMGAKAKVEQAGVLRQEVIDDMTINREKLNLLLGNPLADDLIVESLPSMKSIEQSLEAARNYARAHRPEITISKLQVRNSELSQRISRSAYIPDVSLTVSQTRVSDNTIVTSVQSIAGVTAQWDIFDGGRRRSEISASNKKIKQARNLESETEDQVMIEVGASFKKLQRARSEVNVAELLFSTEQEKLRLVMESLAAESSLRQDVLKQQSTAEAAASQLQQALTKFWLSKAEFENAIGLE